MFSQSSRFKNRLKVFWLSFAFSAILLTSVAEAQKPFEWKTVEPGFDYCYYSIPGGNSFLSSEILLLRFDPKLFAFQLGSASVIAKTRTNIKTLAEKFHGIVGINAHFFDENGKALGLVTINGEQRNPMHKGGNVLTGIFYMKGNKPYIVHRDQFVAQGAELALQSGPRLIANRKSLKLSSPNSSSRRSGIALTNDSKIILYATKVRFPGASLSEIQSMLLHPDLNVIHALNLDGGASSQIYVEKNSVIDPEIFFTGGDDVPVGLIVRRGLTN